MSPSLVTAPRVTFYLYIFNVFTGYSIFYLECRWKEEERRWLGVMEIVNVSRKEKDREGGTNRRDQWLVVGGSWLSRLVSNVWWKKSLKGSRNLTAKSLSWRYCQLRENNQRRCDAMRRDVTRCDVMWLNINLQNQLVLNFLLFFSDLSMMAIFVH